jgi:hypothetical protein
MPGPEYVWGGRWRGSVGAIDLVASDPGCWNPGASARLIILVVRAGLVANSPRRDASSLQALTITIQLPVDHVCPLLVAYTR